MAAVLSFRVRQGVGTQTFAPQRARDALGKVVEIQSERRPFTPRDVDLLRFVFSDLEGYCGLGSNFGHMIEQLAASVVVTDGVPKNVNQLDGLMHVHAAQPCKRLLDLPVESFACWSNDRAQQVGRARAALLRMSLVDVTTLAKMYGQDERAPANPTKGRKNPDDEPKVAAVPPHVWLDDFKMLGDVAPLACATKTVEHHAKKMSREARETLHYGFFARGLELRSPPEINAFGGHVTADAMQRHVEESKVRASPLEALYDLLVVRSGETREKRAARKALADTVRREANALLRNAQRAFLVEMRRPYREKGYRTAWTFAPADFVSQVVGYRDGLALLACGHYVEARGPASRRCRECRER